MVAEILDSLKIDNELTADELNLLDNLNLESFDKDKNIDNMTEMQTALKATTIEIAWEEEKLTLYNIATKFDEYVEQWEWWKLQVKEWVSDTPSWITNIIENPKNNDLAYLIQKVAWLISYKTARQYTEKQLDAVEVTIDKTFGNQTRRALSWLKKWIENDQDYEDINAWQEYAMKYIGKQFIDWLISDKVDNKTKNDALSKYHLQYNNGEILPADWYKFIDLNSSNYAVEKEQNEDVESEAETSIYWKEEVIKKFALEKADSKIRGIDAQQYFWIKSDLYKRAKDNWIYFFDWNILKRVKLTSCYVEKYKWKDTWEKEYPPESAFFKHYLNGVLTDTLRKNKIPVDDKSIIYKDNRYYIKSFGKETQIQLDTLTGWRIVKWSSKEVLWQNLQLINLVNFIDKIKKDKNRFKAWSKFVNRNWNIVVTWYKGHTWDFDIVKQSTWKEKYSFMDKSKTDRFVNYLNSLIVKN